MKRIISLILTIVLLCQLSVYAKSFSDVPESHSYYKAIAFVSETNIMTGYSDDFFGADHSLTRAQMTLYITKTLIPSYNLVPDDTINNPFTDVSADHWSYNAVISAYINGIIDVDSSKEFRPDYIVTYGEALQMAVNACGKKQLALSLGGFPNGYITAAKQIGLTDGLIKKSANEQINKGDVAQIIYNIIKLGYYTADTLSLYKNENAMELAYPLYLYEDSVLCHIRTISELLNANVDYDDNLNTLQISSEDTVISLNIDNTNYTVNGVLKTLKCSPRYIQDRIYVPLQEIVESFEYNYSTDLRDGNIYVYNTEHKPITLPHIKANRSEYIKNPDTDEDIYIKINYNGNSLKNIVFGNHTLVEDKEYEIVGNYILLKKEYIRKLANGNAKFSLNFENNTTLHADVTVIPQIYTPQKSIYKLFFDNQEIFTDTGLYTVNNQFYAPLRAISEACDVLVGWNSDTLTAVLLNSNKRVEMTVNSYTYAVNGEEKNLDTPAMMIDGRMMFPIKVFSDEFGLEYKRDVVNERICLYSMDFIELFENNNTFDDFLNNTDVSVTISSKRKDNISFVVAYYNSLGVLLGTKITNSTVQEGNQEVSIDLPDVQDSNEIAEVKLMIWRSLNSIRPLSDVIVVNRTY